MFLHQHHIIHRYLKPGNVLLDSNLHPHIIDFGCPKFYEIGKDPSTTSNLGALFYMAPESIFGNKYSEKSDVYSFECLMFEVVTDQELYPELKNLNSIQIMPKMASHQIQKPEFKNHVKKTIEDLIKRCWSDDPDKRPTFEELFHKLSHNSEEWITDNEYDVFKYFLDDVDSEKVFSYVDEINELEQFDQLKIKTDKLEEENKHLKKEVESLKKKSKTNKRYHRSSQIT